MPFVSLISSSLKKLGHNVSYSSITDPKQAGALAGTADLVIVAVSIATGEGMDRKNLSLSSGRAQVGFDQDALVTAIGTVAGNKTVVVARCSGAFAMTWLDKISSVLYQLMPGQAGGEAADRLLYVVDAGQKDHFEQVLPFHPACVPFHFIININTILLLIRYFKSLSEVGLLTAGKCHWNT